MMDLSTLSSNWKKLQSTLKTEKREEHGSPINNASQPNHLKRKALASTQAHISSSGFGRKRQRLSISEANTTLPRHKMGAYVSSLPTASYAFQQPATKRNAIHDSSTAVLTQAPTNTPPAILSTQEEPTGQAGKYLAIDCEMVGTHSLTPFSTPAHNNKPGAPPEYSILARVSVVSYSLATIYDAYVLPPSGVTISDYRTQYSGITAWHLTPSNSTTSPKPFATIQREIADLLSGRILIGHAVKNDLAVLGLSHPRRDIRDTARHPPFRQLVATVGKDGKPGKGRTPSLKKLAADVLGWGIQGDEKKGHSSVEDAKATMALFRKEKPGFEREHVKTYGRVTGAGGGKRGKAELVVTAAQQNGDEVEESEEEDEESDDETVGNSAQKKKKKSKRKKRTKR